MAPFQKATRPFGTTLTLVARPWPTDPTTVVIVPTAGELDDAPLLAVDALFADPREVAVTGLNTFVPAAADRGGPQVLSTPGGRSRSTLTGEAASGPATSNCLGPFGCWPDPIRAEETNSVA